MHHGASPRRRSFLQLFFFVAPFVVAAFVIFLAGMAAHFAIEHHTNQYERNEFDCIISKIESGAIAPATDGWDIIVCAGRPDASWRTGEIGGERFGAERYSDRNRWLTAYFHTAPGESGLLFAIHLEGDREYSNGDHWFFIDLDKFNAYLDANTGGRITRSAPPDPQN